MLSQLCSDDLIKIIIEYQDRHDCSVDLSAETLYHGPAFYSVWEDHLGRMWIDSDEYGSRVRFCPLCGAEASNNNSSRDGH